MIQDQLQNADMWLNGDGTVNIDLLPHWVFCAHFFFDNQAHDGNVPAQQPLKMYSNDLLQQIRTNMVGNFTLIEERVNENRVDILVIGDASHVVEQKCENAFKNILRTICDSVNTKWFDQEENKITYDFHPIQSYEKYLWAKDRYLK